MTGVGMSTPSGWLTVEQAAEMLDLEPWRVRDLAVLGGIPLGYGPFPRIAGSDFRVFIDEADAKAWDEAGRPMNGGYRITLRPSRTRTPPPPPPPPQSGPQIEELSAMGDGEPVAWRYRDQETSRWVLAEIKPRAHWNFVQPLFTSPVTEKPNV